MVQAATNHTDGEKRGTGSKTTFLVRISDVRGSLNTPERPVVVKFNVDGGKYNISTNVVRSRQPEWLFTPNTGDGQVRSPESPGLLEDGLRKDVKFFYHTKAPERLGQKSLVVSLCERNKRGAETEWGKASVSLDVLARGCERIKLSMIGKGNYGYVEFRCAMTEIRKVEVVLSDLEVVDYPERHRHELKMIYFEFGYSQFGNGYKIGTEKSSEGDPVFKHLPVLAHTCCLSDMIVGNQTGSQLQVFFSFHRQVSKERTEEIGIGALPIKLIFRKKRPMGTEVRSKFRVPLADFKGLINGRVCLRNVPQYAQLRGNDLVYEDGFFVPGNVDLKSRLLLPWLSLPAHAKQQMPLQKNHTPASPTHSPKPTNSTSPVVSQPLPNGNHSPRSNGHYSPSTSSSPDSSSGQLQPVNRAYAAGAGTYHQYPGGREAQPNPVYLPPNAYDSPPRGQGPQAAWGPPPYGRPSRVPSPRSIGSTGPPLENGPPGYVPNPSTSDDGSANTSSDGAAFVNMIGTYPRTGGNVSPVHSVDRKQGEWVPVRFPNSERFYFANQRTKESLWLPPRWERLEDELGRQFFADHNTQTTQFEFPAVEARMYREHARTNRA